MSSPRDQGDTTRGLILTVLATLVLVGVIALSYRPPSPKPADTAVGQFSSVRAAEALGHVLGSDGKPHPVGSPANAAVRDRIVEQLKALGYEPEIQRRFTCDEWGNCATVENIATRLPGSEPGQAVVLSAHYDSVAAGPGVSDDGAGVAALLEIARVLRTLPASRHAIILLITDGEELSLHGARAFIEGHPWAKEVRAAVNLEARGTSGPSVMFETGSKNAWAIELYDGLVRTPITNSIYYAAYKLLPNDTDFTVFKTRDWQGFNFAFTGDVAHYHTPLDDFAHLSPSSLQHHGENALPILLALAASPSLPERVEPTPGEAPAEGAESVYVDLFAKGLLHWPARLALPAAAVTSVLWIVCATVLLRRRKATVGSMAWGIGAVLGSLLLAAAASGVLLIGLQSLGALPPSSAQYQWTAHPLPLEIANIAWGLAVLAVLSGWLARRTGFWGCWLAIGLLIQIGGIASALLLPGLSFALLLPDIALLLCVVPALLASDDRGWSRSLAAAVPSLVNAAVWFPTLWFFYQNLGLLLLPAVALLVVWASLLVMPLLAHAGRIARRAALATAILTGVTGTAIAAFQPPYTPDSPQRLNFDYWLDADKGESQWVARPDSGDLPAALKSGTPSFARSAAPLLPWNRSGAWVAAAPKLELAAPTFDVLAAEPIDGGTHYRARLASPRGGAMASICFAPEAKLSQITFGDQSLPTESAQQQAVRQSRRSGWRCLTDYTLKLGDGGVSIEFDIAGGAEPVGLIVMDRSDGLPAEGEALLKSRPIDAVPSQDGDTTKIMRRLMLSPASVRPQPSEGASPPGH